MLKVINKTLLTLLSCIFLIIYPNSQATELIHNHKIKGEYIITFASDTPNHIIKDIIHEIKQQQSGVTAKRIKGTKTIAGRIPRNQIEKLHTNPYIKFIETNRTIMQPPQPPNNLEAMRAYIDSWGRIASN